MVVGFKQLSLVVIAVGMSRFGHHSFAWLSSYISSGAILLRHRMALLRISTHKLPSKVQLTLSRMPLTNRSREGSWDRFFFSHPHVESDDVDKRSTRESHTHTGIIVNPSCTKSSLIRFIFLVKPLFWSELRAGLLYILVYPFPSFPQASLPLVLLLATLRPLSSLFLATACVYLHLSII